MAVGRLRISAAADRRPVHISDVRPGAKVDTARVHPRRAASLVEARVTAEYAGYYHRAW